MTAISTTGAAPSPRSRLRARIVLAGFAAVGLAALAWAAFVSPLPRLTYNPSDSVAIGWYRIELFDPRTASLPRPLSVGSIVLVPLPAKAAMLAAARLPADARAAAQTCGRSRAAARLHRCWSGTHRRRACGRRAACRPAGPAAAILAALPPPRTGRAVPVERDQSGVVRQPLFRPGQRIRRDRRRASGLAGDTPMMAVDSLHVAVHLIVPSGMSFRLLLPCRRACSASVSAPHFALSPAQPSSVQASCLERARPAAIAAFAGGLTASSAAPPGRRRPERQRGAKAEGKTKDAAPGRIESLSAHGGTQHGAASPPCRVRREGRANAGMSACFALQGTPELAGERP